MKIMPMSANSLGLVKVQKEKIYSNSSMLKEKQANQSQPTFKNLGLKYVATVVSIATVTTICPPLFFIALPLGMGWMIGEMDKLFDGWIDTKKKDDHKEDLEDLDDLFR